MTVKVYALSKSTPPPGGESMLSLEESSDPFYINASQIGQFLYKFR